MATITHIYIYTTKSKQIETIPTQSYTPYPSHCQVRRVMKRYDKEWEDEKKLDHRK